MPCDEGSELSGRIRAVLAGCDESDPRFPLYARFLQDLHPALRHAARGKATAVTRTVRRWARRGLCYDLLQRLAQALDPRTGEVRHGPQH